MTLRKKVAFKSDDFSPKGSKGFINHPSPVFDKMWSMKNIRLLKTVKRERLFNGKKYKADDVYSSVETANYYARAYRYEGRKARVIPTKCQGQVKTTHFIVYVEVWG